MAEDERAADDGPDERVTTDDATTEDATTENGVPSLDLTSPRGGADGNGATNDGATNGDSDADAFASLSAPDGNETTNGASTNDVDAVESDRSLPDLAPDEETDDDEVEPVELLVQLAEDGEIEPWDIDIVAVTDAFLARLDESDLRTSGRALFYASVLLRMKGDELLSPDDPEPEPEPWEAAMNGGEFAPDHDPIAALESEMDRRLDRKHARGSPETLEELVRDLREAERESWWKSGRTYDTTDSPRGYDRGTQTLDYRAADDFREGNEPTEADVTGTTHAEDIETTISAVESTLLSHYEQGRSEVLFAEIQDAGGSRVETYLALLFLAHRGIVTLQQDELFGDLWVQDPQIATVADE